MIPAVVRLWPAVLTLAILAGILPGLVLAQNTGSSTSAPAATVASGKNPGTATASGGTPAPAVANMTASGDDSPPGNIQPSGVTLKIVNGVILATGQTANITNLAAYVKQRLRGVNIIYSPQVADVVIANLELRGARFPVFGRSLNAASGQMLVARMMTTTTLSIVGKNPTDPAESAPDQVRIFNLTQYLPPSQLADNQATPQVVQEIIDIVNESLAHLQGGNETAPANQVPDFRYHPGTHLFVVVGNDKAVNIAEQAVNSLVPVAGGDPTTAIMIQWLRKQGYNVQPAPAPITPAKPADEAPLAVPAGGGAAAAK